VPTEIWRLGVRSGSARVRREDVLGSKAVQTLLFSLGAEKPHKGKWVHVQTTQHGDMSATLPFAKGILGLFHQDPGSKISHTRPSASSDWWILG
jgi:hypothetical protein